MLRMVEEDHMLHAKRPCRIYKKVGYGDYPRQHADFAKIELE